MAGLLPSIRNHANPMLPVVRPSLVLAISALTCCVPLSAARAFSYAEHCRISNRAFVLAVQQVKRQGGTNAPTASQVRMLDLLAHWARRVPCTHKVKFPSLAYGDLVARVDWAVTPADPFLAVVSADTIASDSLPVDAYASLMSVLQSFRLLHENAEHFGARALLSHRALHRTALDVASSSVSGEPAAFKALTLALYYNAFADHYLEDLYAPGHIFSPRGMLNDAQAGGTHNWYNKRGAYYYPARTSELAPYLVETPRDSLTPSLTAVIDAVCKGSEVRSCVTSLSDRTIRMFGDGMLDQSPEQELLLTLVIARSVSDVLETWVAAATPGRQRVDLLGGGSWCGYEPASTNSGGQINWVSPNVITRFGEYRVEKGTGLPAAERWPTARYSYESSSEGRDYNGYALELMWKSWPGEWLGGNGNFAKTDNSTNLGLEFRNPTRGSIEGNVSYGAFVRRVFAFNRINSRLFGTVGVRGGSELLQEHVDVGLEIGFGLLHVTLAPSWTYRFVAPSTEAEGQWQRSLRAGISATPPFWRKPRRLVAPLREVHERERGRCGGQTYEVR